MNRSLSQINHGPFWAAVLLALCACASPRYEQGRAADPAAYAALPYTQRPYKVFGVWYYPISNAAGFEEQGFASWYGPGFHGKKTSNGEVYDMHELTAAHKILPLGTHVRVTRTDTGKSVVVRLNDRGPFVDKRIIDLSYTAARKLDMIGSGTAPVRIEVLQGQVREPREQAHAAPTVRNPVEFTVPVGDYAAPEQAEAVSERLAAEGLQVRIVPVHASQGLVYRVCVGAFSDLIEAQISAAHLRAAGYAEAHVVTEGK
jgi:rare lipoprotein A